MKNATEFAKKFKKFRRTLPSIDVATSEHGVIGEVIYAHLLWNATAKQAGAAYKKLISAAVDFNDLRMNHVYETVELIGLSYPQAEERAKRMKCVLNAIYKREHGVHVASLESVGKREVRDYFETLNGITPFVSNRVIALCFDVAAVPVDDRTLSVMIANDLVHESSSISEAASWLGRQVKAAEVCEVHVCLHAWVETQPVPKPVPKKKKPVKKSVELKPASKKRKPVKKSTTKKKVAKKKAPTKKKKVAKKNKTSTKKKVVKEKRSKNKGPTKKTTKKTTKKKASKKK